MKKILHVTSTLDMGGVEKLIFELVTHMDSSKFQPMVCAFQGGGCFQDKLESAGIPVFVVEKKEGINYSLLFKLAKLFNHLDIDIVHTHNIYPWLYGGIAAMLSGKKTLVHTEHAINSTKSKPLLLARKGLSCVTSKIVSDAAWVSESLIRLCKVNSDKIILIPNGIDTLRFESIDPHFSRKIFNHNLLWNKKVIGNVSRLAPVKDHETLIRSFALVEERHPEACLAIVGEGPERPELERLAWQMNLNPKVSFLGLRNDIPELLSAMDIFVLSSLSEGFPVALLEAMAAGLPVVATDVGGNREIVVHGETGLLVPPKSGNELAEAISYLLSNEREAAKMGQAGRKRVRQLFSFDKMIERYEAVYTSLWENQKTCHSRAVSCYSKPSGNGSIRA
ncbi:MAG: GT4 family glycosyltransferase PelF [Candidatus Tectomicrobia bacterium]|nr:GT4 family glycosyltransferase PelF [Candidatus Tectomicrobia bacterium]